MSSFKTIEWKDGRVLMIDQTKLPGEEAYVECQTYEDVADAIKRMVIRGAPAIGVAAAMGVALGAQGIETQDRDAFKSRLRKISEVLLATRPTAVNLAWAIKRMGRLVEGDGGSVPELKARLVEEAVRVLDEDVRTCMEIGKWGAGLIEEGSVVMTHCNAGALATGGYGTALGVIRAAKEAGKDIKVIATETRPFLQGARLTAWELDRDGIPVTLITDNMVGHVMRSGMVDAVVVGADRIARNGDVANKIGTYTISVMARTHGIPFYVAAPLSTVDYDCPEGKEIPIEERNPAEVTHVSGKKVAADVKVFNPAFDVTPYENVTSIITENGIAGDPYEGSLDNLRKR